MKFSIIEDCSPYYIRFTHDGIDDVVNSCVSSIDGIKFTQGFTHHRLSDEFAASVLSTIPLSEVFTLKTDRVSLFVTQPGVYYRAHKDGPNCRFSLNYTIKVLDTECITSWYADADLARYPIDTLGGYSREASGFDKTQQTPLKVMTAVANEAILFNTDIFHDFDNQNSSNERIVLTLRALPQGDIYFADAKKMLFGIE